MAKPGRCPKVVFSRIQGAVPGVGLLAAVLVALLLAGACSERPIPGDSAMDVPPSNDPVPSGPHLYCLTNIGHTLVAFDLTTPQPLAGTRRTVELDPVGPWFIAGHGYYLSRVDSSGGGANALIAFDPRTLAETGRLHFPPNSNPTTLAALPGEAVVYVALRGSTFDNFATNGISVVSLPDLAQTAYLDLNDPAHGVGGQPLTSLVGLLVEPGCGLAGGCLYAVANNWRHLVRQGWLLVLEPQGSGQPLVRDQVALGLNPQGALVLDGQRELWVVNNGGYADFGGQPGTVQVLDTTAFADPTQDNETVAVLDIGGDPTAIYPFDAATAWVTTYPDDVVHTVGLETNTLAALDPTLPTVTGPLFHTTAPAPALFAGSNGFAAGRLAQLDPATGAQLAEFDLQAGNGPVSCAEFTRP